MQYLIYILCLMFGANALATEKEKPQANVYFSAEDPVIDGLLESELWQKSTSIDKLVQVWPSKQTTQLASSNIKLMYSNNYLLIGAELHNDNRPITANTLQYNQDAKGDDGLTILIDTFDSKQNAYWFRVNPNGVKNDGLIVNGSQEIPEWNGVWYASSKKTKTGWTLEMAIPFKMLSFDPKNDAWGMNVIQHIAKDQIEYRWSNISQNSDYAIPQHYGNITGLKDLSQGIGMDIRLSAKAKVFDSPDKEETEISPSLDLFYKWSPSISTALTLNTDFSNTDVDDRQVNIGRFNLFLPEKRDFFLQDAGIFEFGRLGKNGRPFFSRNIGLSAGGEAIDINGGIKFTGNGERWGLGLLSVNTDTLDDTGTKQLTVARGTWQATDKLRGGFIATSGNPYQNISSETFGFDVDFSEHQFLDNKTLELSAWLQRNDTENINNENMAWGLSAAYPNDIINIEASFKELQKNFKPALGFVNRNDIRHYTVKGHYRHHINTFGIQRIEHSLTSLVTTDLKDQLKSSTLYLNFLDFTLAQGDFIRLAVEDTKEHLTTTFNLLNKIAIAPENYHFQRYWFIAKTAISRQWVINATWHTGKFYQGNKQTASVELKWQPNIHINTAIKIRNDDINIDGQKLNFSQVKLTLDYIFNNKISWQNYFQYDDLSRQLGISSRLHWLHKPGFESHLIFNANYENSIEESWQQEAKEITLRVGGMWRF